MTVPDLYPAVMPVVEVGMQTAVFGDLLVEVNSPVASGQPLFTVEADVEADGEADKVDLEIEAPVDGVVVKIRESKGSEVGAGSVVMVLAPTADRMDG